MGDTVIDECVEVVMDITDKGVKEILDFVTVSNEGAHSWKEFLLTLKRPELLYPESNRCFMQKK